MKLIIGSLLAALQCTITCGVVAQNKLSSINGRVITDGPLAIESATIVLLKYRDSSTIKIAISDNNGRFKFEDIKPDTCMLKISKIGYSKSYFGPFKINAGQAITIPDRLLRYAAQELKEVAITAQREYVEIKSDKTILNVDQNIGAAGNSVYDVLKTAPGVKVAQDQILYKAGQKALIAINGRPVNLTDEQLADLLRSYAANSVSQIELIQNPSAKYDAASAGGVINIVLKKNKDFGTNISVTQAGSYGDRNQSSTLLNASVRTAKLNIFASYGFVDGKSTRTFTNDRTILTDQLYDLDLQYKGVTHFVNNNFSLGADYLFSKTQTIGMLVSGYHNSNSIDKFNTTDVYTDRQADSAINARSNINRELSTLNYNLNYKGTFGSAGKSTLSANLDYSDYNRRSLEDLNNVTFNPAGHEIGDTLFYRDQSPSHIQIWSAKADFSQALSKNSSIDVGAKISQVTSDNNIDFDQQLSGIYQEVPSLTDNFMYRERIVAGYAVYNLKYAGTGFVLGLRGEETSADAISVNPQLEITSDYFNLFPKLLITRSIDKDNDLSLSYARSIIRPNYQDLNPFIGYVDQFYYNTGNPFLKPEYINRVDFSDFFLHKYKATLSMAVTDDFFSSTFKQNDTTKAYTTTKSNIATRYQYLAEVEAPVGLTNWWDINFDVKGSYEIYNYLIPGVPQKNTVDMSVEADQRFVINKRLSAQVYGFYEIPTYFGISQYKSFYFLDAGLRYSILANYGSVSLYADDIFNTNINRFHSNFQNLDLTQVDRFPNRYLNATFTYRFGKKTVKTVAKHKTGIDDETNRLKTDN